MHQNLVPPYGPRRSMILHSTVVQKSTHTSVFPLWVYVQSLLDGILNVFSSFAPPPSILSLSLCVCTCVCTQSVCVCLYVVARDPPVSSPLYLFETVLLRDPVRSSCLASQVLGVQARPTTPSSKPCTLCFQHQDFQPDGFIRP